MKTVKEIWSDLFDSSLECYKYEDEPVRNFSMISHILKLEFEKAGQLIVELKRRNELQRKEISEYKQNVELAQQCGCENNNRTPLKTINAKYNETTPIKKIRISMPFDSLESEDLLNHQISDLNVNLSKENDESLFIDNSVEDFDIVTSPTLTKHKSNRLSSKMRKEGIKNLSFEDLVVVNTPTPKINRSKSYKKCNPKKLEISKIAKPHSCAITSNDSTFISNRIDPDETFIPQSKISNENVPTDTEVKEILEDLKENASKQNKRIKLNNSYDRIPEKKHTKHAYENDPVRKKSERMKLPGWTCKDCEGYYESLKGILSAEEIKERLDKCSRHRSKYNPNTILTPKGYWNPDFSESEDTLTFNIKPN